MPRIRLLLAGHSFALWSILSAFGLWATSYNEYDKHLRIGSRLALCSAAGGLFLLAKYRPVVSLFGLSMFCALVGAVAPGLLAVQFLLVIVVFLVSWKSSFSLIGTLVVASFGITVMYYAKHFGEGKNNLFSFLVDAVLTNGLAVGFGSQTRQLRIANDRLAEFAVIDRRNAVIDERRRIARELHDVAAHHLSALIVKSKVALKLDNPDDLRSANQFASRTATEALNSMRALVSVLSDSSEDVEFVPQPTLDELEEIQRRMEVAGLHVDFFKSPDLPALTRQVELAIVRIVQESLTNVLRHRGPGKAWISIDTHSDVDKRIDEPHLSVTIDDDGNAPPGTNYGDGTGHGLLSMSERVSACGGTFSVEPSAHGGWRIAAVFPFVTASGARLP